MMALLPACAKGAVVASKAVSWCTKLERHPLKAYFWRAVGQQGAEHKLGRFSILRLVPEDSTIITLTQVPHNTLLASSGDGSITPPNSKKKIPMLNTPKVVSEYYL